MEQPINITPEMRAFNEAIERFDRATFGLFDRFTLAKLYSLQAALSHDSLIRVVLAARRANITIE